MKIMKNVLIFSLLYIATIILVILCCATYILKNSTDLVEFDAFMTSLWHNMIFILLAVLVISIISSLIYEVIYLNRVTKNYKDECREAMDKALNYAYRFSQASENDIEYKDWVIDQMVRALNIEKGSYEKWVSNYNTDGYIWKTGRNPKNK